MGTEVSEEGFVDRLPVLEEVPGDGELWVTDRVVGVTTGDGVNPGVVGVSQVGLPVVPPRRGRLGSPVSLDDGELVRNPPVSPPEQTGVILRSHIAPRENKETSPAEKIIWRERDQL